MRDALGVNLNSAKVLCRVREKLRQSSKSFDIRHTSQLPSFSISFSVHFLLLSDLVRQQGRQRVLHQTRRRATHAYSQNMSQYSQMTDSQLKQTISQLQSSAGVTPRFPTWQNQLAPATPGASLEQFPAN